MKGLLLKDWYIMLNKGKVYFIIIPAYLAIAVMQGNGFFLYFCAIFAAMLPRTLAAYDDHARWSSYTAALPLSKAQVVLARYVVAALVLLFTMATMAVIYGGGSVVLHRPELLTGLPMSLTLMFFLFAVYLSFSMPLLYRFGTEKGRIIQMVLMVVLMMLAALMAATAEDAAVTAALGQAAAVLPVVIVVAALLLLVVSYFLSVKWYSYTPNL